LQANRIVSDKKIYPDSVRIDASLLLGRAKYLGITLPPRFRAYLEQLEDQWPEIMQAEREGTLHPDHIAHVDKAFVCFAHETIYM
jgi:hypothetical protein